MPDRGDVNEFFDGTLTYRGVRSKAHPDGRTYVVPEPDARTGLWLAGMGDAALMSSSGVEVTAQDMAKLKLDDNEEASLYQVILGPVYDEMITDGVSWSKLKGIASDAFLFHAVSPELADVARAAPGEAEARTTRAAKTTSTAATPRPKAGSRSKKASTVTAARRPAKGSTRSSTSTPTGGTAQAG